MIYQPKPKLGIQLNRRHPLAKGLVGCWVMNEKTGNKIFDLSGHGNDGTIWGADWVPEGLDFNGISDYVDIGAAVIPISGDFTFSSLLNHNPVASDKHTILVSQHTDNGFIIYANTDYGTASGQIRIYVGEEVCIGSSIDTGIDTLLTLVKEGTTYTLYLNGIYDASGSSANTPNAGELWISGGIGGVVKAIDGIIFNTLIHNRALSPYEVAWLHREPYAMFQKPISPTLLYYEAGGLSDTGLFDAKLRIKDSSIVLVDGLLRLKDKKIDLLDGKAKILDVATILTDGKVVVQDTGQHTFDTKNRNTGADNPLTVSVTPTTGATVLVVGILVFFTTARTGGAPTFNGVALSQAGTIENATETSVEMWYLVNPSIGTYNVSIPNTNNRSLFVVASVYKASTGFTSALDVVNQSNNTTANPSLSVTPTVNGAAIVDIMGNGLGVVPTANNQTLLYSTQNTGFTDNHQYALQATAGLIPFTWTIAADDWCMIVAAFKPVAISTPSTDLSDGKIKIIEKVTSNADGKVQIQDVATSLADGKVQVKDVITSQADGKVKVLDTATSLADGKVNVLDVTTNLADGKVQVKDVTTNLVDGKVKIIELVTNLADGKIKVKDVYTDIVDGLIQIKDSTTNLLDGKVRIKFIASNLIDGKIKVKDSISNLVDGKVRIKDVATGLADGKIQIGEYVTNLVDGKVIIKDITTGLADGKVRIKDVATGLANGLVKVIEKATSLTDGKVRIKDKATGLADGLVEIVGSVTSQVDGKIKVKDISTTLADGKVKIIEKVTLLVDGKVRIKDKATGIADGKVVIKDAVTELADGLVRIKDSVTNLADGKIKIKNLATSLADGKVKIKNTITDLLDGKVTITDVITGHPWFYRRKQ